MIPFICISCGQFSIDTADCTSCDSDTALRVVDSPSQ